MVRRVGDSAKHSLMSVAAPEDGSGALPADPLWRILFSQEVPQPRRWFKKAPPLEVVYEAVSVDGHQWRIDLDPSGMHSQEVSDRGLLRWLRLHAQNYRLREQARSLTTEAAQGR